MTHYLVHHPVKAHLLILCQSKRLALLHIDNPLKKRPLLLTLAYLLDGDGMGDGQPVEGHVHGLAHDLMVLMGQFFDQAGFVALVVEVGLVVGERGYGLSEHHQTGILALLTYMHGAEIIQSMRKSIDTNTLKTFAKKVKEIERAVKSESKQGESVQELMNEIEEMIPQIEKALGSSRRDSGRMVAQKQRRQFANLLAQYRQCLQDYQTRQTNNHPRTSAQPASTLRNSLLSPHGHVVQIELQPVQDDTVHEERMVRIKEAQVHEIKQRMDHALRIQQDMQMLVYRQGDDLTLAEGHIQQAKNNINDAAEDLEEGEKQMRASRRKICCIMLIVAGVLLAIIVPVLVKFG